jgi:RNA polymerase sigma factor (TIGR02999 family)
LPLVYDELRRLAAQRLNDERPGQTLQPTALVHEAYLRLVGKELKFDGPRHFLFAAARAMHDILVERARQKGSLKGGGGRRRLDLDSLVVPLDAPSTEILALAEALAELAQAHPRKHQVVSLRFFAGCTSEQAAAAMDLSPATVAREWRFARAWLHERLSDGAEPVRSATTTST